ncbi:MAG: PLP-dependent aminotransferase family protein [Treponema sp.]|nr:PLP-dependent aminotransferase family protein [Treponema sp.]
MLSYSFSDSYENPLYLQLYNFIRQDIAQGVLNAHQKLPSKRAFAENLGVSVITVENAYEQLIAEGYIYSYPKKGFFVCDLSESLAGNRENLQAVPEENDFSGFAEKTLTKTFDADFSSNRILPSHFPYSVWSRVLRDCLIKYQNELLLPQEPSGCFALRKAIADYLFSFRGMKVNPAQVIIGAGTEYLYGLLVQLLGRDKTFCVEDPGYKKVSRVYGANGAAVKYAGLSKNGIKIEDLENQKVDVVHISPSHQFPTGIITPVAKRRELLAWASAKEDRYIIEDDYDSEFRMTGVMIPTLQRSDTEGKVIYLNTFTKTLSPTIRVSYMILPSSLIERYYSRLSFYSCPVSSIVQYAIAEFIEGGSFEKHINRLKNFYRRQRDFLIREIRKSGLNQFAEISEENSGLHFLLSLKINCSDEEFKNILEAKKIRLLPLSEYFHQKREEDGHVFVMNYSSLTEEAARNAVQEIYRTVKELIE